MPSLSSICTALLLVLIAASTRAELPYKLPPKAKYTATEQDIARAKADLTTLLTADVTTLGKLFASPLICGPGLWNIVKDSPHFGLPPAIKTTVKIPTAKGVQELPMATFKIDAEIASFRGALCDVLSAQGPLTIREPNEEEFKTFWAVIPFDVIDGPLLVAVGKDFTILCMYTKDKMLWIDEVRQMNSAQ